MHLQCTSLTNVLGRLYQSTNTASKLATFHSHARDDRHCWCVLEVPNVLSTQPPGGQLSTVDTQQVPLMQGKGITKIRERTFEHLADCAVLQKNS